MNVVVLRPKAVKDVALKERRPGSPANGARARARDAALRGLVERRHHPRILERKPSRHLPHLLHLAQLLLEGALEEGVSHLHRPARLLREPPPIGQVLLGERFRGGQRRPLLGRPHQGPVELASFQESPGCDPTRVVGEPNTEGDAPGLGSGTRVGPKVELVEGGLGVGASPGEEKEGRFRETTLEAPRPAASQDLGHREMGGDPAERGAGVGVRSGRLAQCKRRHEEGGRLVEGGIGEAAGQGSGDSRVGLLNRDRLEVAQGGQDEVRAGPGGRGVGFDYDGIEKSLRQILVLVGRPDEGGEGQLAVDLLARGEHDQDLRRIPGRDGMPHRHHQLVRERSLTEGREPGHLCDVANHRLDEPLLLGVPPGFQGGALSQPRPLREDPSEEAQDQHEHGEDGQA